MVHIPLQKLYLYSHFKVPGSLTGVLLFYQFKRMNLINSGISNGDLSSCFSELNAPPVNYIVW